MRLLERIKIALEVRGRDKYKEAVLSLLERDSEARILDLGCGDSRRLTKNIMGTIGTQKAYGVDINGQKAEDGIVIFQGDLNTGITIEDKAFDVVIASQVIEHLWNTDLFLKEIYRILNPSGYAIISTPNLAAWHNILSLVLEEQPGVAAVSDEMYNWVEKPGHRRVFTQKELIKLLEFHRFKIEKVIGSGSILGRPTTVTVKIRK